MLQQQGLALFYTAALGAHDEVLDRAWKKFVELTEKAGHRGVVALNGDDAAHHGALPESAQAALKGDGPMTLKVMTPESLDPFPGAGWPVLAITTSPGFLLQLLEDRRLSGLVYVPQSTAELRHFELAFAGAQGI